MENKPWLQHYDTGVPASIDYLLEPLHFFLEQSARLYPDHICTSIKGSTLTYQQMDEITDRLAGHLLDLGLKKGDRVGIFMPNVPHFMAAFYAILKAGGVVAAMNPQYKAREIEFQMNDAGVELVFVMAPSYYLLKEVQPATRMRQMIACERAIRWPGSEAGEVQDETLPLLQQGDLWLNNLLNREPKSSRADVKVTADDVAIFQYSGGTTGVPKGAVGLHRNLIANSQQFCYWQGGLREGEETMLLAIPLYHVYGMVIGMSLGVVLAAKNVLVPNPRDLNSLLDTIEREQPTIFPGVPSLYGAIVRSPDVQAGKYNLRSIRACISGSAPLPAKTKEAFEAVTGGKLVEGYGLSEAPTATHCNPMKGENRTGSIGLPLPDVDCRIVDQETGTRDIPVGEAGELIVRGPQVMAYYHQMPEETAIALRDGWLYTGDIARMDPDGYFYLVDRKKEVIKIGGFQVWPREVEDIIQSHPKVVEAAVAGVPDPERGEAVKAWVVVGQGEELSEEEVRFWCNQSLARYKVPSQVEFRNELPRTTVGKILRRELVRQHKEGYSSS